ncbi:cation:proton antiporter [Alkalicoccus urumqiensis]|uniref:cation:proton antiporter n=1 Tax=Alkalicoccus urumqiensis TaxID=1548213 RepID=UPI0015E5F10D|nr:cation:proton antiporter [Alkalicoccus urumqiensis]
MDIVPYIILLFIGYLVFTLDKHKELLPAPPLLAGVGIVLSFIPAFSGLSITADTIYHVLLPGLLFVGAYQFRASLFRRYAGSILSLSTLGIVLTIGLAGSVIYFIAGPAASVTFSGAMLLAAVFIPTDPVSVIQILSRDMNDELVVSVVEGESMINDGTSIVAFTLLLGWYTSSEQTIMTGLLELFLATIAATALGLAAGWLFSKAVHITHDRQYQIMLSIVVAYAVFLGAEALHMSGVIAVVCAGLVLSHTFEVSEKEDHFREALDGFWGVAEASILSILFLFIGIAAAPFLTHGLWLICAAIFLVTVAARWLVAEGLLRFLPITHRAEPMERFLISISGVKGAISIYLILKLQEESAPNIDILTSISFTVVLLSLLVQSVAIHPAAAKMAKKD